MREDIDQRARDLALYIIETGATVRAAATRFGVSKSTVHIAGTTRDGLYGGSRKRKAQHIASTLQGAVSQETARERKNNGSRLLRKSRLSAYNLDMKQNYMQIDYTAYEAGYQLKLPMETEIFIAKDSPVRLLNAVVEGMDTECCGRRRV